MSFPLCLEHRLRAGCQRLKSAGGRLKKDYKKRLFRRKESRNVKNHIFLLARLLY